MPTPGDFSCAELFSVKAKTEEIWADNAANSDYVAHVESARAVIGEQSANINGLLNDPAKDRKVQVEWIEQCDMTPQDCTDQCGFPNQNQAQANCKEYEIDQCKEVSFTISDEVFRTSSFSRDEVLAKQLLKADKALSENLARAIVAAVDSFAGVNQLTDGIGTVQGNTTYVGASYWTPDIVAYLIRTGLINQMNNTYQLNGNNLFENSLLVNFNQDPAKVGDKNKLAAWKQYWDLFNVDSTIGAKVSYLIDRGALAVAHKARYSSTPQTWGNGLNQTRFKMPSQNLAGLPIDIEWDIRYRTRCQGDDVFHDYVATSRYGIFQNPLNSCNEDITGILRVECGNAPAVPAT